MLGTKITKHRIGQMTLEQLRRPVFPFMKNRVEVVQISRLTMPAQHFRRAGGRTGARVEQRDVHFPSRECSIENRKIANDYCQKSKAIGRFDYSYGSAQREHGNNVAVAEREKRLAADIKVGGEVSRFPRHAKLGL